MKTQAKNTKQTHVSTDYENDFGQYEDYVDDIDNIQFDADYDDINEPEPYSEYDDYEDEPTFEKTNRHSSVRKFNW